MVWFGVVVWFGVRYFTFSKSGCVRHHQRQLKLALALFAANAKAGPGSPPIFAFFKCYQNYQNLDTKLFDVTKKIQGIYVF